MIDYYVVLGVPQDESAAGIRAAFRGLVKRLHPDRSGGTDAMRFREVAEAYRVLSDERARRRHDVELARESPTFGAPPHERARRPLDAEMLRHAAAPGWPAAEPLADPSGPFASPLSVPSGFAAVRPGREELLARLARTATGLDRPKGGGMTELHVEVLVSSDDAARGGALQLRVPVPRWCAACAGTGRSVFGACGPCAGAGIVEHEAAVRLPVPRLARDATFAVALDDVGLDDVVLHVHLRMAPWHAF